MKLTKSAQSIVLRLSDETDEVSSKHCFEVVDETDEVGSNMALRLWMKLTKSVKTSVLRL